MRSFVPTNTANPTTARYFLILFILSILLMGQLLWPFASILIISLLLVNLFRPLYHGLRRWCSNYFASLGTCVLIVLLVFIPLLFFVIALSKETVAYAQYIRAINLAEQIKNLIHNNTQLVWAETHLQELGFTLRAEDFSANLSDYASNVVFFLYNKASTWAANILMSMLAFALMIVVIFFLLVDYSRFLDFILRLSPLPERQNQQLIRKFQEIARAILVVNGISGLIQGVVGGLLFAYFDFNSPVLWGMIMGVVAFLPIAGIGLVLLPTCLIVFLNGHVGQAIFIALFYLTLSMSMEYLLKPQLVGRKVNMHPLLVFVAILGGMNLFGVLGIIYGPLIITGFLTMADIYLESYAPAE